MSGENPFFLSTLLTHSEDECIILRFTAWYTLYSVRSLVGKKMGIRKNGSGSGDEIMMKDSLRAVNLMVLKDMHLYNITFF